MTDRPSELNILECTLRDGSYAVNFKFTVADTRLLAKSLADLGFTWIEVGHGLGIGAVEAGKTPMPADDFTMIRAAKEACPDALIGCFFIPWFGRIDHLDAARDSGLDFARFGENPRDIERTFPFVEHARKLGIRPCVNFMKSYSMTPEEFGKKARACAEAGAEVVYCVDSAGCMMPEEVGRFFAAARAETDVALGFHGHNNLMMVIANCIAAYENGASFLDTTLCGFGRSAGNAPTEILVATLERIGIPTGIDIFEVLDLVQSTMWPLVRSERAHDMLGVTSGYSAFHSSFLPKVVAAARSHDAELRRLVARVGLRDPVDLDEAFLEQAATELAGTRTSGSTQVLVNFDEPRVERRRVASGKEALEALLDGLVVAGAKRRSDHRVLSLVPADPPGDGMLLSEFVVQDQHMVMGQVTFGGTSDLETLLAAADDRISLFLVDSGFDGWSREAVDLLNGSVPPEKLIEVHGDTHKALFVAETLNILARRSGPDALLVYGTNPVLDRALELGSGFSTLFVYGNDGGPTVTGTEVVHLDGLEDVRNLQLQFNTVVCGFEPSVEHATLLARLARSDAVMVSLSPQPSLALVQAAGDRLFPLDPNLAYTGIMERINAASSVLAGR